MKLSHANFVQIQSLSLIKTDIEHSFCGQIRSVFYYISQCISQCISLFITDTGNQLFTNNRSST